MGVRWVCAMAIAVWVVARQARKQIIRARVFTYSILDGIFIVCTIIANFSERVRWLKFKSSGTFFYTRVY